MPDERTVQNCAGCRWGRLERHTGRSPRRECRFDAPRVVDVSGRGLWPTVNAGDWCRQWTPTCEDRPDDQIVRDAERGTMGRERPQCGKPA